jgi:hypothetical protein
MLLRAAPYGFIRPALPSSAEPPPNGTGWIHEIKYDGYRLMVRRDSAGVRLLTQTGQTVHRGSRSSSKPRTWEDAQTGLSSRTRTRRR